MGFRENILSDSSQPIGKNLGCSNPQRFCEEPDTWAWAHSANGILNSKSAYSTWVWKAKTTRRLQDFLCLAVQDRIPTKSLLCHRQIIQENICLFFCVKKPGGDYSSCVKRLWPSQRLIEPNGYTRHFKTNLSNASCGMASIKLSCKLPCQPTRPELEDPFSDDV